MNKETLQKYIRSIVRDEIKHAFQSELREHLVEMLSGKANPISNYSPKSTKDVVAKSKKLVKYTNNDVLNKVLNETRGNISQDDDYMGHLNSKQNDTNSGVNYLREAYSQAYSQEYPDEIQATTSFNNIQQHSDPNVQGVLNVLNRDFSSTMKKVEEKSKNRR